MSVAIVDSGGANIASLTYALRRQHADFVLSTDPDVLKSASHVILPGVGAADDAMRRLEAQNLTQTLRQLTQPVLGICLGMQLLAAGSAEDKATCLGITDDNAERFTATPRMPVPHMGWNQIQITRPTPLLTGIASGSYFYFVHSYALAPGSSAVATCDYGLEFAAVIQQDNFFGTQFHPERSAAAGAKILENFLAL
ncbi:MAG: imidazole glycerol phosphate synthase subunit HisH [Pseudomonadota bacterium]